MTKREVKEYLEQNANKSLYIADELTKEGYGQTKGEYHKEARKHNIVNPTQKWHFTVAYYDDKRDRKKQPTYNRLLCPELILWIAEVAGLNKDILTKAKDFIVDFEDKNKLRGMEKGGNYIRKKEIELNAEVRVLREFKNLLHIGEINRIIKDAMDWDEVMAKVGRIEQEI